MLRNIFYFLFLLIICSTCTYARIGKRDFNVSISWDGVSKGHTSVQYGTKLGSVSDFSSFLKKYVIGNKETHEVLDSDTVVKLPLELYLMEKNCADVIFDCKKDQSCSVNIFKEIAFSCNLGFFAYNITQIVKNGDVHSQMCVPERNTLDTLESCLSEVIQQCHPSQSSASPHGTSSASPHASSSASPHGTSSASPHASSSASPHGTSSASPHGASSASPAVSSDSYSPLRIVEVSTIEEIFPAIRNAKPGDMIKIAPGTYDFTVYQGAQKIDSQNANGEEGAPIIITAADPKNPPVITGINPDRYYVLHIEGDYFIIENLILTKAQKGIVLEHSSHSIIRNCEVYNTGSEAILLKEGSSYNLVSNCNIHDTGKVTPGFGEGVYIGQAKSNKVGDHCDYNTVYKCTFKNIAAEHVDIKEYTTGNVVDGCTFDGTGMTGANYAGSFIDIAGSSTVVKNNVGRRNNNDKVVAAFEMHEQGSNDDGLAEFYDNTVYLDREISVDNDNRPMYVVDGWYATIKVKGNKADHGKGLVDVDEIYYNVKKVEKVTRSVRGNEVKADTKCNGILRYISEVKVSKNVQELSGSSHVHEMVSTLIISLIMIFLIM